VAPFGITRKPFGPWLWDPGSFKVFPLGGLINRFFRKKKKNMSSSGKNSTKSLQQKIHPQTTNPKKIH